MPSERGSLHAGHCSHAATQKPTRPVPDWTGVCPDCGERVKHHRGGLVTVREVNAHLAAQVRPVLDPEDVAVLREALWHAVQRGDISDDERRRAHDLRDRLATAR